MILPDPKNRYLTILQSTKVNKFEIISIHAFNLLDGTFNPFQSFRFTGELRPLYPLSPRRLVPPGIPRPDYAEDGMKPLMHQFVST